MIWIKQSPPEMCISVKKKKKRKSTKKHCCSVTKLCLTLWEPKDCSLPGSSVLRISQARILEWVVISSSRGSSWLRDQTQISCIAGGLLSHLGSPQRNIYVDMLGGASFSFIKILCIEKKERQSERSWQGGFRHRC